MSRNGTRDTNSIPKDKVPAFVKLIDAMAAGLGSTESACRYAGVNSGQFYKVRQGGQNLSVTAAKRILAGYRRWKAER